MNATPPPSPTVPLAARLAAAQDWWREAGVDFAYLDAPRPWLAEPPAHADEASLPGASPRAAPEPEPAPRPAIGGDRALWPRELAGFREWWLAEPTLDPGGTRPRVAPRGEAGAPLMMLVPMPEEEDADALLQGPQGRLLASIAAAMGFAPAAVYLAAALPRHAPMPDWRGLAAQGLGEVLRHHIGLAAPARLMVFGRDVLSLLGHDPTQAAPFVGELAIQDRQLPLMAGYAPARLLGSARGRAQLWRRWLEWTEGEMA